MKNSDFAELQERQRALNALEMIVVWGSRGGR